MGRRDISWARTAVRRLLWGAQEVGFFRTMVGLLRLVALAARRPARAEIVTVPSGFRIAFDYPAQLMPLLVVFQELIDPELGMLGGLLGPGRVAVDIGASIGPWTLCAAKTGASVYACEPDAENFSVLQENVRSNGFASNVVMHNLAFGSADGWSRVSQGARRYLTKVSGVADATQSNGTRLYSFDQFVRSAGLAYIVVLKINTAGSEADVLSGGKELFRQEKVGVAIVLDGLAVRPLLDELKRFSYELGFYDGRKRKFVPVAASFDLDELRPGPMNRHVVVKHSCVTI